MSEAPYAIGIDIGGTKIITAQVSAKGEILDYKVFPTQSHRGYQDILAQVIEEVKILFSSMPHQPIAIGIGMAGQILHDGTVKFAPNLRWRDVTLKRIIAETLRLPVYV